MFQDFQIQDIDNLQIDKFVDTIGLVTFYEIEELNSTHVDSICLNEEISVPLETTDCFKRLNRAISLLI